MLRLANIFFQNFLQVGRRGQLFLITKDLEAAPGGFRLAGRSIAAQASADSFGQFDVRMTVAEKGIGFHSDLISFEFYSFGVGCENRDLQTKSDPLYTIPNLLNYFHT